MSISLMTLAWRLTLPSPRKMVLLALADSANDGGECYPSVAALVEKCSMSERSIQGHISALEAAGFLSRILRRGRSTIYQLHPRRFCTPADSAPPQILHPPPADSAPTPADSAPYTPADSAPITVIEPSSEPSGEPPPTPASQKTVMRGGSVTSLAAASLRFEEFWSAWPVKKARVKALVAWRRIRPSDVLADAIIAAVGRHKRSEDWQREGGRFIPHAATWLNGRRWEDEAAPVAAGYSPDELEVMAAYNVALAERGWPCAVVSPFDPARAAAIRAFVAFRAEPNWTARYFTWLGDKLEPREGCGFDWAVRRSTFLRAVEGNFAALREAA